MARAARLRRAHVFALRASGLPHHEVGRRLGISLERARQVYLQAIGFVYRGWRWRIRSPEITSAAAEDRRYPERLRNRRISAVDHISHYGRFYAPPEMMFRDVVGGKEEPAPLMAADLSPLMWRAAGVSDFDLSRKTGVSRSRIIEAAQREAARTRPQMKRTNAREMLGYA